MRLVLLVLFFVATSFASTDLKRQDRHLYKAFGFLSIVEIEYRAAAKESGFPYDEPFELLFDYKRSLSRELLIKTATKELAEIGEDLSAHKLAIDRLNQTYSDVEKTDRYRLSYHPILGTRLYLNEQLVFKNPGYDFARRYFSIWLESTENGARLKR